MIICIQWVVNPSVAPGEVSGHLFHRRVCPSKLHPKNVFPNNIPRKSLLLHTCWLSATLLLLRKCLHLLYSRECVHQLHLMECLDFLICDEVSVTLQNVFSTLLHSRNFLSHSTHSISISSLLHLEITSPSAASKVTFYLWVGMSIHPLYPSDWRGVHLFAFVVFRKSVCCRN